MTQDDTNETEPTSGFNMEFHEFKQILEEVGQRSELSKGSFEVGRKLAHLPD